ncbi:MAG: transporter substrate-binding domain-containing protein, partial [Desulfarculus sp.]|nr:transporter substrate-binding domain-containing protein [Desulfarculus sp.]
MLSIGRLEKIIQSLLAGIFLVFAVVSFAQAEELTQQEQKYLLQKGTIVFISQTHYPPFEFLGQDGDHTGMSIELARWIATRFGFKTRFIDASFKDAQETVLSGKTDVITSLFYSKKRDQVFDLTQIMFSVPASIFVKPDRPDIKRVEDLHGKTIAMQAGDYAYEFLESRRIKFKVVWTSNFAKATDMVIAGKADAVIGDEQIVLYHIYSNHLTDLIKKVGMPLYVGENCMGVKHGNHVLQGILNKGISLAKETGTLDRINTTWLGIQYKVGEPFVIRNLNYFLTSAGLLIALALLAWLWNIRLRILVNKRAEALSHSEATLRAILANSPLGIGLVKNQVMVWHNQALGKMLGSGLKELDGQNLAKFFPNAVAFGRTAATIGNSLNETGEAVVETKCVRMDGTALDCVVHCAFLGDGEDGDAIIVMAQDISEQKQAQTKLIESEERYRLLAEHASDVIWTIDKDFKLTYVSPSVEKLRGFTPAEVVGQTLEKTLSPKSMQLVHEVIKKITAQIAGGDHDIP